MPAGGYQIPHQSVSLILLELGSNISLDALRILARDNTGLTAVGEDGVRFYAALPAAPGRIRVGPPPSPRRGDPERRLAVARRFYARRSARCCRRGISTFCAVSRRRP
ncbi:MAG: hypothetical protein J2P48_18175 [Alphaproteobacteria bacterium]|nr:hypothetical protein [Alphaproteobacteria bacterium]